MKKINLMALLAVCMGSVAHADYQCTDFNNEVSMTVNENHITHLGNTSVLLVSATETTQLFGTIHSEGGVLLQKKVVELYPYQGDTLTIVSKPKSCGRGSCDWNTKPIITANLKIGETQTYFSCQFLGNETNP